MVMPIEINFATSFMGISAKFNFSTYTQLHAIPKGENVRKF